MERLTHGTTVASREGSERDLDEAWRVKTSPCS